MITLSGLNDISKVRHGFFTREGGVSSGIYASLNMGPGSKDAPENVATNRARAMEIFGLPAQSLVTLDQVHSGNCITLTEVPQTRLQGDALVTNQPNLVLGILTADCVPVLFAHQKAKAVGAAHAGWKGAIGSVLESTLQAMAQLDAKAGDIVAAIGPCIAQRSYEVGPDFPAPFLAEAASNADFFAPSSKAGHFLFDLPGYVARKLLGLGVADVIRVPADTLRDEGRFYSYRRTTLRGEPDYGRQMSAIFLEGA